MRKSYLLLWLLSFSVFSLWAERIDVQTATKIAENVAARNQGNLRSSGGSLSLVYAAAPGQEQNTLRSSGGVDGAADYFVFNVGADKGFVIVSGDDRAYPVLGYSNEGNFDPDNLPDNLRGMLAYYQDQISWAEKKGLEASAAVQAEWGRNLSGGLRSTSKEVLYETAHWAQSDPFNRQTPVINGYHAVTGCVATAWAIAMKYNEYPKEAVTNGVTSYYGGLPVTYAPYEWDKMPLVYKQGEFTEEEANAVAALMWNLGANFNMSYGVSGSGAYSSYAATQARDVFGFSEVCRYVHKSDYRWAEWKSMLRTELDEERIVIYDGTNSEGGHAFVCDGYRVEDEAFHINWGWGNAHGWYLLSALDAEGLDDPYSSDMDMTIGIRPPQAGDTKVYELKYKKMSSLSSLSVGTDFNVTPYIYNTGSIAYTGSVAIAVIQADGTIGQKISSEQTIENLGVGGSTTEYTFTCQLTQALSEGEKILPIYSVDGTNWSIMTGTASAPLYIDMSGLVSAEDDSGDPEVKPANFCIYWNALDNYMSISTADVIRTSYKGISYGIMNATEGIVIRYTLQNYQDWEGTLSLSNRQGDNYVPVEMDEEGSFEVPVAMTDFESSAGYVNYLGISSKKVGKLKYDIQIYYESDSERSNLLFEQKDNVMTFVNPVSISTIPNPITGTAGQKIPFEVVIGDDIDQELVGKAMELSFMIQCFMKEGVKLYYVDGEEDKKIALISYGGSTFLYSDDNVSVGTLTAGGKYAFKLECATVPESSSYQPYIQVNVATVGGKSLGSSSTTELFITQQAETYYQIVTTGLSNLKLKGGETQIKKDENLSVTLVADDGYNLPAAITVKVGGQELQSDQYMYNSANGNLYIASSYITGDIEIIAIAVEAKNSYTVTNNINTEGLTVAGLPEQITEGEELTFTLTAKEGYVLPEKITVTVGDGQPTEYTVGENGVVTISGTDVTGNITITAEAIKVHTVTANWGNGIKAEVPETILNGEGLTVRLSAETGYVLPNTITVTMGGTELIAGTDYTYADGTVTISKVTGNVVITATAIQVYQVTTTITNLDVTPEIPTTVQAGETISFTLSAKEGYKLPESITVKVGETTLTQGNGYTYDQSTGAVAITGVQGSVVITAEGVVIPTYTVTYTLTNVTCSEQKGSVNEGEDLSFTLTAATGYELPKSITVTMAGVSAPQYTYDAGTGKVVISNIQGNTVVTASGIDNSHYEVILTPAEVLIYDPASLEPVAVNSKVEITLSVETGYTLPAAITATMGGKTLVAGTDYSYDAQSGKFLLEQITGALTIVAVPVKVQYDVQVDLIHLTSDYEGTKVEHNTKLDILLTPDAGYELPAEIEVKMGETVLTVGTGYTYNTATGQISIASVTGAVSIKAEGKALPTYAITLVWENLTADKTSPVSVKKGDTFTCTLTAETGYRLPESISVTDADNNPVTTFTYDRATGTVTVTNVQNALTITAKAEVIPSYEITFQLTHLETDWKEDEKVLEGETLSCTLTAQTGYRLPESLTVTMNGAPCTAYTYDSKTGKIEVKNVTGKVVITATGIDDSTRKVEYALTNVSVSPKPATVPTNSKLELTFTANEGYTLPTTINVVMDGKTLSAATDYTYNSTSGEFSLAEVTGNLVIYVVGVQIVTPSPDPEPDPTPVTYTVTLPVVEGAILTAEGSTKVEAGKSFAFTLTLKEGYKNSQPVVKANGVEILPDANGRYVINNVTGNVTVTVTGVVKDNPTANAAIGESISVWTADGTLHIHTSTPKMAYIITFSGQIYQTVNLPGGDYETMLPKGAYIIRIGEQVYKVQI